jgi:hypothetical protein
MDALLGNYSLGSWQMAIHLPIINFTSRRLLTAKGDLPGNSAVQNHSAT